jgi:TolB-like protein
VLSVLVERAGELVTKEEIMAAVWRRTVVENANLTVQIAALRRILDQGRSDGSCIQTVAAHGYRFLAPVTRCQARPLPGSRGNGADRGEDPQPIAPVLAAAPARPGRWRGIIALLVVLVVAGTGVGWISYHWRFTRVDTPPRLSIAVLPFVNLSGDPSQQHFADGVTEDVTTDLSRIDGLFVIDRNTAFTLRNNQVDTKQIDRGSGVRYMLQGSVQQSSGPHRVTARLIDAETGGHLWAEQYDRDTNDLFAFQDDVARRIAAALCLVLVSTEASRSTGRPEVFDYLIQARATKSKGPGRETFAEVLKLSEQALALDPRSVGALSMLGGALAARVMLAFADSPRVDLERAEGLIAQALAISPRNPGAHFARAIWFKAQGRCEEAIPEFEMLVSLDRNWVDVLANLGQCKIAIGSIDEGIALQEQVLSLSPTIPSTATGMT